MKKNKKRQLEVWDQKGNKNYEETAKVTFYALLIFLFFIFAIAVYAFFFTNK